MKTPNPGWLSTAIVALAIVLVAVACGAEDEAEPTTVATQPTVATVATQPTVATTQTTQAPTTTAPPPSTTAPPTPLVESAGSLEDLFITDTTTGREVMERISQSERDCLHAAIGEQLYGAMLALPMKRLVGEVGTSGAGSFLGCLTDDNVVLMGLVLIDSHHGRTDPEARAVLGRRARERTPK